MGNDQELRSQGNMEGLIMEFSITNMFGQKVPSAGSLKPHEFPNTRDLNLKLD